MSLIVPDYNNDDVDTSQLKVYRYIQLLWERNVVVIIDFLTVQDKINLFCVSKKCI